MEDLVGFGGCWPRLWLTPQVFSSNFPADLRTKSRWGLFVGICYQVGCRYFWSRPWSSIMVMLASFTIREPWSTTVTVSRWNGSVEQCAIAPETNCCAQVPFWSSLQKVVPTDVLQCPMLRFPPGHSGTRFPFSKSRILLWCWTGQTFILLHTRFGLGDLIRKSKIGILKITYTRYF